GWLQQSARELGAADAESAPALAFGDFAASVAGLVLAALPHVLYGSGGPAAGPGLTLLRTFVEEPRRQASLVSSLCSVSSVVLLRPLLSPRAHTPCLAAARAASGRLSTACLCSWPAWRSWPAAPTLSCAVSSSATSSIAAAPTRRGPHSLLFPIAPLPATR